MAQLLHLYCHSAIQDGGFKWRLFFEKFKKTNNSDCMQDNCIIPTAIPIFSWSRNLMNLFFKLCGASGSQKSKMAVLKEEIRISLHVYNIAAKFQRQNSCVQG